MSNLDQLVKTANEMVAAERGILAADESSGTIKRRFDAIGVESTEDNRRDYRELLFRTEGANKFISGVILYRRDDSPEGAPTARRSRKVLVDQGIIPGIKVDAGAKPLAWRRGEKVTEGLDGLRERLAEYTELGARFAKWRAVITIGDGIPIDYCIEANAQALARYAALCRRRASSRSSSPRSSWTAITRSTNASTRRAGPCTRSITS